MAAAAKALQKDYAAGGELTAFIALDMSIPECGSRD
jgi:hypothetical protein